MKNPDIDDGEDEDVAEDVAEDVDGDVVEGAEQDEDETDNALDVQHVMDELIQETTKGWATGESTSCLELRQRHVPRG